MTDQLALARAIKKATAEWPEVDFIRGHCHDLAVALYRAMKSQGRLLAGMQRSLLKDSARALEAYAHMVYQAPHGTTWDAGGRNADGRWEETYGLDEYVWVEVPFCDVESWLQAHNATFHAALTDQLTLTLRSLLPKRLTS